MATRIINKFGKMAGWNSVRLNLLGRNVEGITAISYNDTLDIENAYGAGAYPVGRGEGNYEATASITLYKEEAIALQASLPPGKRIQEIAPFDIVVEYDYNGFKYKDRIRNCQFRTNGVEVNQGDKTMAYQYELVPSHIEWNSLR